MPNRKNRFRYFLDFFLLPVLRTNYLVCNYVISLVLKYDAIFWLNVCDFVNVICNVRMFLKVP